MKRNFQWAIVIALNTVFCFVFGVRSSESYLHWIGMILGVITWYFIYVAFDKYLIRSGAHHASKKLMLCALLRAPMQLTFFPDYFAALFALLTAANIMTVIPTKSDLNHYYLITVFTGLYLSIICVIIFFVLSLFMKKVS